MDLYQKGTRVWHPDVTEGWMAAEVEGVSQAGDKVSIVLKLDNGEEKTVTTKMAAFKDPNDSTLPPLANPPIIEASDDLTSLSHLNEPAVLQAIKLRYMRQSIYTYSGIVLIATNPFYRLDYLYNSSMIQGYAGKRREDQEPHLFAIAEEAYRQMLRNGKNQTVVVSGESGAGKTVSAKHIMRYFATVEDPDKPGKKKDTKGGKMSKTEEEILATNPIMEAFGNAKTTRNDNSSRFGKYIEIMFDQQTNIIGAKTRIYLLERSRLVYQPPSERNYHIFYQLIAGSTEEERKEFGLEQVEDYFYLNQGGDPIIPNVDDAAEFTLTRNALTAVNVSERAQREIWKMLAALLHLGNAKIGGTGSAALPVSEPSFAKAAELLGVDTSAFAKWMIKKQRVTGNDKIMSDLTPKQGVVVKDSVAKYIYASLFDWLVVTINARLLPTEVLDKIKGFIGVLDIYGFEHFKKNSFEQFCINFANEKLQQSFNQHVFKLEQEEYVREEISWSFIDFSDNQPCIELIEGKLGILSLLDEESRLLGGSDGSFVIKLDQNFATPGGKFEKFYKKARFGKSTFTVCHYAVDVTYDVEGFIEKNRDTVPDEHMEVLNSANNEFLTAVLKTSAQVRDKSSDSASATPAKPSTPAPLAPGRPGRRPAAGGANRKPTLGGIFKASLIDLVQTIGNTEVHYIRCIKPNEAKVAFKWEGPMVLSQLRACGVLETVRISCAGYPTRWTYEEFAFRYYMLLHSSQWGEPRDMGLEILKKAIEEEDKYQLGKTKIFFRAGMLAYLENIRTSRLNEAAVLIQKNLRMRYYRRRYLETMTSLRAVQSLARGWMARSKAQELRRVHAATTIQRVWRGQRQRKMFLATRKSVVRLQALCKGRLTREHILQTRLENAARIIQRVYRSRQGIIKWRQYRRKIVIIQSLWRKKEAKKVFKSLREEARSLDHIKEVSYKLENKVVELTQTLQKRTEEKKALESQVDSLESQLKVWRNKATASEQNQREAQGEVNQYHALSARLPILEGELKTALKQYEESEANSRRLQEDAKALRDNLAKSKAELERTISRFKEQESENLGLKQQITLLEDEMSSRPPPSYGGAEPAPVKNGGGGMNEIFKMVAGRKPTERQSVAVTGPASREIYGQVRNYDPRPQSMAAPNQGHRRNGSGASDGFNFTPLLESPETSVAHILEDENALNYEVSSGLIQNLKIPQPNSQNPPEDKEVLFPAYLINLVTSEMWHNGFVKESERFLATVMQNIQQEVMHHDGEELINLGAFWLSNVHEMLSFVFLAEDWYEAQKTDDFEYDRLLEVVKHDLESLEFNIYHTWMKVLKKRLYKMIVPAIIESQSLPGFVTNEGNRFLNKLLQTSSTPAFSMDDLLSLMNKVYKAMKTYYLEDTIVAQAMTELLKLIGVTAFNDLLLRRNFLSWKRGLQINYNITRIEEWCKSHDMPEGTLQLEHLMQATKLLQLKKATLNDIEIIQDICWMLSPQQIQKLLNQYLVADYEQPINGEIMKAVEKRAITDKNEVLLLAPVDMDDSGPYEIAEPRQITALETYLPSWLQLPKLRRLTEIVSAQAIAQQERDISTNGSLSGTKPSDLGALLDPELIGGMLQ
ncbi:Myosin type-2 heavy chain 1 [Orbilia oligospora]|uniref:Myosin type-2 heavy chain 1 n=1 Tax=Orbilia oligospora TaxID=2813651 RepID=A0A6G1MKW5_ORBOL|nr:Myosin type-2 heavy chain 1 [Orbilia oligospora]KAF3226927.1 Myosin type-2 heavy chain 1 [Orbilia oligospora]KAF3261578.1 Myosin type-2 heavy chain 1 [Orbilia oligospora]